MVKLIQINNKRFKVKFKQQYLLVSHMSEREYKVGDKFKDFGGRFKIVEVKDDSTFLIDYYNKTGYNGLEKSREDLKEATNIFYVDNVENLSEQVINPELIKNSLY